MERGDEGELSGGRRTSASPTLRYCPLRAARDPSSSTVMVLLRGLLVLLGRGVPRDPIELAAVAAAAMGIEGEPFLNVIRHRADSGWRCSPVEFAGYMDGVARAAAFLDQLQLGDQR